MLLLFLFQQPRFHLRTVLHKMQKLANPLNRYTKVQVNFIKAKQLVTSNVDLK